MFSFHVLQDDDATLSSSEAMHLDDEREQYTQLLKEHREALNELQEEIERREDWIRILAKTRTRPEYHAHQSGFADTIIGEQQKLHPLHAERNARIGAQRLVEQRLSELDSVFVDEHPTFRSQLVFPPAFLEAQQRFFSDLLNPYRHNPLLEERWLQEPVFQHAIIVFFGAHTPHVIALHEQLRQESVARYPTWPEQEREAYLRQTLPHHALQLAQDIHRTIQAIETRQPADDALESESVANVYEQTAQLLWRSFHRAKTPLLHEPIVAILKQHQRYGAPPKTRQAMVDLLHTWLDQAVHARELRSEHAWHTKRRYQKLIDPLSA